MKVLPRAMLLLAALAVVTLAPLAPASYHAHLDGPGGCCPSGVDVAAGD